MFYAHLLLLADVIAGVTILAAQLVWVEFHLDPSVRRYRRLAALVAIPCATFAVVLAVAAW